MISTATLLAFIKSKTGIAALILAAIKAGSAERARQHELIKELGTLASRIENAKLLGQPCNHLEKQYEIASQWIEAQK